MKSQLTQTVVLTIDSDPVSLAAIRTALDCQGYKVHTAQDPDSAMEISRNIPLDLIITELNVSGKCGIELLMDIREFPGCEDVPVMFASAGQAPDIIRRTHNFGAAFHVKKPVDPLVLTELVQKALWMPNSIHNHMNQAKRPFMSVGSTNNSSFPTHLQTNNLN